MNCIRVIAALTLLPLIALVSIANASVPKGDTHTLKVRTGKHPDFLRIVFEGQKGLISKGKIAEKDGSLIVRFPNADFSLKEKGLAVKYKRNKESVIFPLKKIAKLKTFFLRNPDRLVIDVYGENGGAGKKAKPKFKTKKKKGKKTVESKKPRAATEKAVTQEKIPVPPKPKKIKNEEDFIPKKYKSFWTLLKSGNSYGVIKELPLFKPEDAKSLSAYHYIMGKAYENLKSYLSAIDHYRLAYIYSTDDEFKALSLMKRADLYYRVKFYYEAQADYLVFIKNFPSSPYIEEAHLGLAKTLARLGNYSKAVEHYKKAGQTPEALFGRANALQRLGKVKEAKRAYKKALLMDKTYPEKSPETAYLMGENMRMTGDIANARKRLLSIKTGPYKDEANISLGLIALHESDIDKAVRYFRLATSSRDHKLQAQALFNLAKAYIKEGNIKDAILSLEKIRHNYHYSNLYKDTLLVLSKLYRKEGKIKESVFLLKELVYGKHPPREAFRELEEIVLEMGEQPKQNVEEELSLVHLWNEVGQWLIDETREDFLIKVAEKLRHDGKPFLDLCTWLIENGSRRARGKAAVDLADYYISIGDADVAQRYINIARKSKESGDSVLRIEAKILHAKGNLTGALKKVMLIKKILKSDLRELASIISDMNKPGSKDVRDALVFYEKVLNKSDWDAETYIDLADLLYTNNEKRRALKYYRIAYKKNPEDEWVVYRLGRGSGMPESRDMFSKLQKGDSLIGRLAKSRLIELALLDKVKEVY